MLPASGSGARPSSAPPPVGPSAAAARLAAALDRIATALVRRAEEDAVARDRDEQGRRALADEAARPADAALDTETVAELRHRVETVILMVRAALGEA